MRARATSIALLCLGALLLPASGAQGASAKPAWQLGVTALPTNFVPGSESESFGPLYLAVATNVGGAPTSGEITFADTLPLGIKPISASGRDNGLGLSAANCEISGQTVTCNHAKAILPGHHLEVLIGVKVDEAAMGAKLSEAQISGGGALPTSTTTTTTVGTEIAPFDFLAGFGAPLSEADGAAATQAGSHPYQLSVDLGFPTERTTEQSLGGTEHLREAGVDLPHGMVVDPAATPTLCTEVQLISEEVEPCPPASQVGTVTLITVGVVPEAATTPLYNMVPPPGVPASFGFDALGAGIFPHILGSLRSDGDYGISGGSSDLDALGLHPVFGVRVELWGDPTDSAHDGARGNCALGRALECSAGEAASTALLTAPDQCSGEPTITTARADSWEQPGVIHEARYESADLEGNPVVLGGCNALEFEPTIESKPTTNLAESPSGLDFDLHEPQNTEPEHLATAPYKDISVTFPQGMTLNPAAADGIDGCSSEQIGLLTGVGESPPHLSKELPNCPAASKIGTVVAKTPLLAKRDAEQQLEIDPKTGEPIAEPIEGSVYLAKPFDNPFGSLLAIYLSFEDQKSGTIAKVPGKITPDPVSGQLVASFEETPELPVEDATVHLFSGARAPLITPPLCGTHTTTATITPWSAPEGKDVKASDSFQTSAFPGGGNCPTSPGQAPNSPAFRAGTIAPQAGAYSPFVMKLAREDGSQRISGLDTTLAPGLIGKLAGVSKCSEAQIASAKSREAPNMGAIEQANPSCPASSELGTVDVGAGAGPTPLYVKGHAYLAGPYKGAPLSLAVITPAVAGPFDLGAVTIRVALYVNAASAQIHAVSDPFPTTLEGIPLDIRSAALKIGRPNFTLNPTSCDPMKITGNANTEAGQVAALSNPFQVGGCSMLGFKPKLALKLKGGTKRGGHPAFQATYTPKAGDANLKSLVVRLPRSAFLDQAHIRTICTRVQFAAKACPAGSQYGFIKAWTPLLEEPLEGPVYLRSSDHNLPDLVFDLHGVIDVEVATRIDSVHGGIRASIESAPDAPLTKTVLKMQGAKKGLIINSRNLCGGVNRVGVELTGQNGKLADSKPELKPSCGKKGHKKHGKGGHGTR